MSENITSEKIITEFLDCILNDEEWNQSEFYELSQSSKNFCDKYHNLLSLLEPCSDIELYILTKRTTCKYIKQAYANKVDVLFRFYDSDVQELYIKCFNNYCQENNYNITFPHKLETIFTYISLAAEEYEINRVIYSKELSDYNFELGGKKLNLGNIVTNYDDLKKNVAGFEDRVKDAEKRSNETGITVLGVFSAIVLAFNGALTISSSTINALPNVSPYRMIVFVLLLGFVLINIIFALFYFLNAIIVRNSFKGSDIGGKKQKKNNNQSLNKWYIIIIDAIMIVMIIATIVCWRCGVVENRDAEYPQTTTSISEEVSVTADIYIEHQTQE